MNDRAFGILLASLPPLVVLIIAAGVAGISGNESRKKRSNPTIGQTVGYLGRVEWEVPSRPRPRPRRRSHLTPFDIKALSTYVGLDHRRALKTGFSRMDPPRPGDWRSGPGRHERHQDFRSYIRYRTAESLLKRRVLILRAHGNWSSRYRRLMPVLTRFMSIFFQREVKWGKPLKGPYPKRNRGLSTGRKWVQYWTRPLLQTLKEDRPFNAVAVLGVTTEDLYPDSSWNFVFGEARLDYRVGVYSLARLFPDFYQMEWTSEAVFAGLLLAMKVLSHEAGHMLGIHHCLAYKCGMNGCNSLVELDKNPLPFCPACLAKMAWKLRFDPRRRYVALAEFFHETGYSKLSKWYAAQARRMGGEPNFNGTRGTTRVR